MFRRVLSKLKEPYPSDYSVGTILKYSLVSTVFVYLFMKFFQPFGLAQLQPDVRDLLFAGYGLICGLLVLINSLLLPRVFSAWFREESWNTGKHIGWSLWITLTVGLACFFFTRQVYHSAGIPVRFIHFLTIMAGALLVGGLLVGGITLINLNLLLRRNARLVSEVNSRIEARPPAGPTPQAARDLVTLVAANGKDEVQAQLSEILFLASEENYVALNVRRDRLVRLLLRSSLTGVERQVRDRYPQLFRCHRAYMINLAKVLKVSGNAQGLKLTLADAPASIPVARRYVPEFRRVLSRRP